ncbi:MAG: PIN domain-containing protein [Hyphomicrobiaceae bacterium]|nr:PIN domain-containing protein [Hyphomicrobiaceae bacterium]
MVYFADTWFWIALINKKDAGHSAAQKLKDEIGDRIVTSQLVLVELLAACRKVALLRALAIDLMQRLEKGPIKVIANSSDMFERAFAVYARFSDKEWSLVDCASFEMMRDERINEVLTNDGHFTQAGFLIRNR